MTNFFRIFNISRHSVHASGPSAENLQRNSSAGTLSSAQLKQIVAEMLG
jgi:hypothetical protein